MGSQDAGVATKSRHAFATEKLSAAEQQALADQLLLTAPAHDQDLLLQTVDDGWRMWEALRHKYTRVTVAHLEAMHRKLRGAMLLNPSWHFVYFCLSFYHCLLGLNTRALELKLYQYMHCASLATSS